MESYEFAFVIYSSSSETYEVKKFTHPMNKIFDLNDQTRYEQMWSDFQSDVQTDVINNNNNLVNQWALKLVENQYPFVTTGNNPILLGYDPSNTMINIGST